MELFHTNKRSYASSDPKSEVHKIDKQIRNITITTKEITDKSVNNFSDLGLCQWVCDSSKAMGMKRPTPIQKHCIPAILNGSDVMACAETGSGKTAAFALPILHTLSQDPYGIYCVVLTPTRELATQISEQINALGTPISVRTALIIGGVNQTDQSISLSKKPHIVIATPGRLRHHLDFGASVVDLRKAMYLVLDEADRLMSIGFSEELQSILSHMSHPNRRTLLFSATLTSSLEQLQQLAVSKQRVPVLFDLTQQLQVPPLLTQQYLFVPSRIKTCYLIAFLQYISKRTENEEEAKSGVSSQIREVLSDEKNKNNNRNKKGNKTSKISKEGSVPPPYSLIIFVGTCRRCEEIGETLRQMNIDCVSLHSLMTQSQRSSALGKFKSEFCRILVATDVASRGLDIPTVQLVINFDLPKVTSDYIHRIGRTARAGRSGLSLSFVTQFEIGLLQSIEAATGNQKMKESSAVKEEQVIPLLNPVSKAMRLAAMKLSERGVDDKIEVMKKRKRIQRRQVLRKYLKVNKEVISNGQEDLAT